MILSFQTNSSTVLENYLEDFKNPKNMFIEMIHNVVFTEKHITRIKDIVVIEQESLINVFGQYAMLPSATMIILGLFFNFYLLLSIGSITLIFSMILLSKHFLMLMIMIKLKISGHKEKIEYVSDGYLLSLLLMEYNNGTTRSVRNIKE